MLRLLCSNKMQFLLFIIIFSAAISGCLSSNDTDGDGLFDDIDNCVEESNPSQEDFDGDGQGDTCDQDDDSDGVLDGLDIFPFNSNESKDSDNDGYGDNEDKFPNDRSESLDSDGDGYGDNIDAFPNYDLEWSDNDGDNIGDNLDDDDDNDDILDVVDQFALTPFTSLNSEGPFNVGSMELSYMSPRGHEITIQVWYPTNENLGDTVVYDSTFGGSGLEDALPDCSELRPVAMYSHGFPSIRWGSSFLMSHLASHGFISVAPDHPHMTIWDINIDYFHQAILSMPSDIKDSFDWLIRQNSIPGAFENCISPNEGYAMIGQSTGGYNSMLLSGAEILTSDLEDRCNQEELVICKIKDNLENNYSNNEISHFKDDRIWGALLLSPWNGSILDQGISKVGVPTMILSGNLDDTTTITEVNNTAFSLGNSLIHYAILNNSGHYAFAPIGCEAYGCEGLLDIEISTKFANQSAIIFLAGLLNWPNSGEYSLPMEEFAEWQT